MQENGAMKRRLENLTDVLKGEKVTILGHDNIDVDAALSGILMSKFLDFLGIENQFCILEPVKEDETFEIVTDMIGINMKNWQGAGEDESRKLFLVDHFETVHAGEVLACVDHHPTKKEKDYEFKYVKNSCATAYMIYELMKEANYPLDKEDVKMIIVSMMVDTTFRSSKTIKEEVEQAKQLSKEYQIDYNFLEKCCLCLTPIDRLSTEQIISNGQKWYDYSGKKVGSAYLQLYGMPEPERLQEWLSNLRDRLEKTSSDMLVFIIFETKNNVTYEYQIMKDCIKKLKKKGILSRGKNIMPLIETRYLGGRDSKEKMEEIVKRLASKNKTIATMESCTAGLMASEITNVEGASEILKESYVTYCNDAKIKFGVPANVISKYTVYSTETAISMAKAAQNEAKSDIGIGITGQLGRIDPNNKGCENNSVWYAITGVSEEHVGKILLWEDVSRLEKKEIVTREIIESLYTFS